MFLFSSVLIVLWTKTQGLSASPDRSQFFRWDSVVLDCENSDWILLRTTRRDSGTRCGQGWGETQRTRCLIQYIDPMDSGWYWCESQEGRRHGGRNITVTDQFGPPAETPPPTTETPPAAEYTPPLTTETLRYEAETPPQSTETPPPAAETPPPSQRPLAVALVCHLLVLCPYVLSTVVMLSLCRHMRSGHQEKPVTMRSPTEAATGLDEQTDDITAVTTEHLF